MTLYRGKYRIEPARLSDWDYRSRGWYFVTICSHNRASIFGEVLDGEVQLSRLGRIANLDLQNLHCHYSNVQADAHVVMPNHVHALIMIDGDHCFTPNPSSLEATPSDFSSPQSGSLSAIVRSYKAGVTRQSHEMGCTKLSGSPASTITFSAETEPSPPSAITSAIIPRTGPKTKRTSRN